MEGECYRITLELISSRAKTITRLALTWRNFQTADLPCPFKHLGGERH